MSVEELWASVGCVPPVKIEPMASDRGMSASLFRCFWADHTAVLKISRQRHRGERELQFFLTASSPHLPELLGSWKDEDRVLLLLQDLGEMIPGDILCGVSPPMAMKIMSVLGQLHAQWWNQPLAGWSMEAPVWRGTSLEQIEVFIRRNPHPWATSLLALPGVRLEQAAVLARQPVTICHADAHLDNWMLGEQPVLIDWETARVGPGIIDVARVLMEGVHTEVRHQMGDALMETWVQQLPAGIDYNPVAGLQAAVWWSLNAMIPHHAEVDFDALSPRMVEVHRHCARQAMDLAQDVFNCCS